MRDSVKRHDNKKRSAFFKVQLCLKVCLPSSEIVSISTFVIKIKPVVKACGIDAIN